MCLGRPVPANTVSFFVLICFIIIFFFLIIVYIGFWKEQFSKTFRVCFIRTKITHHDVLGPRLRAISFLPYIDHSSAAPIVRTQYFQFQFELYWMKHLATWNFFGSVHKVCPFSCLIFHFNEIELWRYILYYAYVHAFFFFLNFLAFQLLQCYKCVLYPRMTRISLMSGGKEEGQCVLPLLRLRVAALACMPVSDILCMWLW